MTAGLRSAVITRLRAAKALDDAADAVREVKNRDAMTELRQSGLLDVPATRPVRAQIREVFRRHGVPLPE